MTITTEFIIYLDNNKSNYIQGYVLKHDPNGINCDWIFTENNINKFSKLNKLYKKYEKYIKRDILERDFFDTLSEPYILKEYGLIIEIEEVRSNCGFDGHDFYTHSCNECFNCGFYNGDF